MFNSPTRAGFSKIPRPMSNLYKEKMSAPNNAYYVLTQAHAGLPNSVLFNDVGDARYLQLDGSNANQDIHIAPGWSFYADGLYGGNIFATGRVEAPLLKSTDDITATNDITAGSRFFGSDGSAASPTYSFTSHTSAGMYATYTYLAFAHQGRQMMQLRGTKINLYGDLDMNDQPIIGTTYIRPESDNADDIGSPTLQYKDLYLGGDAIIGGDVSGATATITGTGTFGYVNITDETQGYQIDGAKILTNEGVNNLFIGEGTGGGAATIGENNIFIGYQAGYNDEIGIRGAGSDNIYFGYQSGFGGTADTNNRGKLNIAMGAYSLYKNTTGNYNLAFGTYSLYYNTSGDDNIGIGYYSLINNIEGTENVAIGTQAGYSCLGSNNVFIGYKAGYNCLGSNKLYIDNSDTGFPLIYGDFSTNQLHFYGAVDIGINTTNYTEIKDDGEINLHGTARVTKHLLIDPARFKLPAANYPGESFEGIFYTLDFDDTTEESAYCQEQIPWRWDEDTDIEVVVDWMHTGADAGTVVWGLEYKSITTGETFAPPTVTITKTTTANSDENELIRTTFTSKIVHGNLAYEDIIAMRFYRKAGDVADTLAEDARVVNIHFHFIQNKLGRAT